MANVIKNNKEQYDIFPINLIHFATFKFMANASKNNKELYVISAIGSYTFCHFHIYDKCNEEQ